MLIYLGQQGQITGPHPIESVLTWQQEGRVSPHDLVCIVGTQQWMPLSQLNAPGNLPSPSNMPGPASAGVSFDTLKPQLLKPLQEFIRFDWIKDWKIISIVLLGIFPLMSTTALLGDDDYKYKYWALALYFSVIWVFFFNGLVKPENATTRNMLVCFFGTGLIAIPVMLGFYEIDFFSDMAKKAGSEDFSERFIGFLLGVTILEEACKLAILVVIWKWMSDTEIPVRTFMFYGLMSGLGFGIYEGVMYQMERNNAIFDAIDIGKSGATPEQLKEITQNIYITNVWRLTTLPFLHATWCAISGFFFGLSTKHGYRGLLICCGLGVSSLLHAGHNSIGDALSGWGMVMIDALSVLAMLVYWRNQANIEESLSR